MMLTRHNAELDALSAPNGERIIEVLKHTGIPI